jgi:hypothetical protein
MFEDPYDLLSQSDVSPFEKIAQNLLSSTQPAAHNCTLPGGGGPVAAQAPWTFFFGFTATNNGVTTTGSSRGSFFTAPTSNDETGIIGGLHASNISLTEATKGSTATQQVTIHVGAPISFRSYYLNTLKAAISVLRSSDPTCPTGSTGTLTVTSGPTPTVGLAICGGNLLQGTLSVNVQIDNT